MNKPYLIEFSGTPEAGKTSTINRLLDVLKEKGIKVGFVGEAASRVYDNLPSDTNDYGIWVITTTIKEIVEQMNKDYDVVLVDRGILDRIFWNIFTFNKGDISQEIKKIRDDFMLSEYIPYKTDLLIVLRIPTEESIRRKGKEGKFVNVKNVDLYNYSLDQFLDGFNELKLPTQIEVLNTLNVPKEQVVSSVMDKIMKFIDNSNKDN